MSSQSRSFKARLSIKYSSEPSCEVEEQVHRFRLSHLFEQLLFLCTLGDVMILLLLVLPRGLD